MRIERFGSESPSGPAAALGSTWGLLIGGVVLYMLLSKKKRRRNSTSERGSVQAISGERRPNASSRTRTEVRSPTSTRTEVRSPTSTSTSTRAKTTGNVTVTGGAGKGNTSVTIRRNRSR